MVAHIVAYIYPAIHKSLRSVIILQEVLHLFDQILKNIKEKKETFKMLLHLKQLFSGLFFANLVKIYN